MRTHLAIFALLLGLSLSAQQKSIVPLPVSPAEALSAKAGVTRAVIIDISDYQDPAIPDLRFADRDAEAFANFLRSPAGGSRDGDHLKVLTNQNATAGRIAEALDGLLEQTKEGDHVIIYFSGHGDVERKTVSQPGFLLAWDAPSRVYMGGGTYSLAFLQEVVTTLSTQNLAKVTVITDACHAGKLAGSQIGGAQLTSANLAKQYANEVKILSCQPNEFSLEGEQWGGGRGAFSFHLVDGLYGLADGNSDGSVNLMEIGRHLEDHVTPEVSPQSQVPMTVGNRTEKLAAVFPDILAQVKKNKAGQLPIFSATDNRGIEDEVLATVDSTIRALYFRFKETLKAKVFLEPPGECADAYYLRLMAEPKLERLHNSMRRNYAAALQDDAQQAMNIWLKADVQQMLCTDKTLKTESIPRQLARAAELLGEGHYMYRSLQARRLLFKGISQMRHGNPDERLGRQCLSLFRQSLEQEHQSPLAWYGMSLVYMDYFINPDSAFICARQARSLAPEWVFPFAVLGYGLTHKNMKELAKQALEEADAIDSLHPYVINRWASWYYNLGGKSNLEKAAALFEQYKESGGWLYPCWFNDYSLVLKDLGRIAESEAALNEAISLDSTNTSVWGNLGVLYNNTNRYAKAESSFKKAISLDSTNIYVWINIGDLYTATRRYVEAEVVFKKAIALDSTKAVAWSNLGFLYTQTHQYAEAEPFFKKALTLDSMSSVFWNNLGFVYVNIRRYAEAEPVLKKAMELDLTDAASRKHLGMVYFKTNRPDEVRQNFLKAIELYPDYAGALLGMAYLVVSEGNTEEALRYVEVAIGKGSTFEQLQKDEDLAPLRDRTEQWKALMKKYFPDKVKD